MIDKTEPANSTPKAEPSPGCIARGHVWNNYNAEFKTTCMVCGVPKAEDTATEPATKELPPCKPTPQDQAQAAKNFYELYGGFIPCEVEAARLWYIREMRSLQSERDRLERNCDAMNTKLVAVLSELATERARVEELEKQVAMIPGFVYGKTMLVPMGSIGDLVALNNQLSALREEIEKPLPDKLRMALAKWTYQKKLPRE